MHQQHQMTVIMSILSSQPFYSGYVRLMTSQVAHKQGFGWQIQKENKASNSNFATKSASKGIFSKCGCIIIKTYPPLLAKMATNFMLLGYISNHDRGLYINYNKPMPTIQWSGLNIHFFIEF